MVGIAKTENVSAIFVRGGRCAVEFEECIAKLFIGVGRMRGGGGGG